MDDKILEKRMKDSEVRKVFRFYDAARIGKITVRCAILDLESMRKTFKFEETFVILDDALSKLRDPSFEVKKRK